VYYESYDMTEISRIWYLYMKMIDHDDVVQNGLVKYAILKAIVHRMRRKLLQLQDSVKAGLTSTKRVIRWHI
jgi:hypothetical protein